jgi:hypothetical protein
MYVCEICGRKYRSRAWLDRHMELKHGTEATERSAVVTEGLRDARVTQEAEAEDAGSRADDASLLAQACEALSIENKNVLSSRVYGDRVVIVEGPVGYKRVCGIE